MTTLTGIKNAEYLARFLGKKIAVQDEKNKKKYYLYPKLYSITCRGDVLIEDKEGIMHTFRWERCENPYVVVQPDIEVIIK